MIAISWKRHKIPWAEYSHDWDLPKVEIISASEERMRHILARIRRKKTLLSSSQHNSDSRGWSESSCASTEVGWESPPKSAIAFFSPRDLAWINDVRENKHRRPSTISSIGSISTRGGDVTRFPTEKSKAYSEVTKKKKKSGVGLNSSYKGSKRERSQEKEPSWILTKMDE